MNLLRDVRGVRHGRRPFIVNEARSVAELGLSCANRLRKFQNGRCWCAAAVDPYIDAHHADSCQITYLLENDRAGVFTDVIHREGESSICRAPHAVLAADVAVRVGAHRAVGRHPVMQVVRQPNVCVGLLRYAVWRAFDNRDAIHSYSLSELSLSTTGKTSRWVRHMYIVLSFA